MDFKLKEIKTVNEFIGKETLEKMKMIDAPKHIKEHFNIVPSKDGIWKYRKKE